VATPNAFWAKSWNKTQASGQCPLAGSSPRNHSTSCEHGSKPMPVEKGRRCSLPRRPSVRGFRKAERPGHPPTGDEPITCGLVTASPVPSRRLAVGSGTTASCRLGKCEPRHKRPPRNVQPLSNHRLTSAGWHAHGSEWACPVLPNTNFPAAAPSARPILFARTPQS
jgi:hypothetical protein